MASFKLLPLSVIIVPGKLHLNLIADVCGPRLALSQRSVATLQLSIGHTRGYPPLLWFMMFHLVLPELSLPDLSMFPLMVTLFLIYV